MIPAQIVDGNDVKIVKNLGWLLRNRQLVKDFVIDKHPAIDHKGFQPDCVLIANLKDGRQYKTGFADSGILSEWLDRPVFRGVNQTWNILPRSEV